MPGRGRGGAREDYWGSMVQGPQGWMSRGPGGAGRSVEWWGACRHRSREGAAGSGPWLPAPRSLSSRRRLFFQRRLSLSGGRGGWWSGRPGGFCSKTHFLARKAWRRRARCRCGTSWSGRFFRLATWGQDRSSGGRAVGRAGPRARGCESSGAPEERRVPGRETTGGRAALLVRDAPGRS